MRKSILPILMFGMVLVFVPAADARSADDTAITTETLNQQWGRNNRRYNPRYDPRKNQNRRYDRRINNRRAYSYTTTRMTRRGLRMYRETIRVTHQPNGRVRTQVIRRVRIR